MQGRTQAVVAMVMAYAVMAILISPAVPSPQSTVPSQQTVDTPRVVIWFTALLFGTARAYGAFSCGEILAALLHLPCSGCDSLELTTALRC